MQPARVILRPDSGIDELLDLLADKVAERITARHLEHRHPSRRLLTVKEAALELNTTESALRAMLHRKQLAAIKQGRSTRIEASEIEAFIERNRTL